MKIGSKIPKMTLPATGGAEIDLASFKGKVLVVYFYPKDNTPGCTQEGIDFRDLNRKFEKEGALVFGVSRDSVRSHDNFAAKYKLPFPLLSDGDEKLCKAFDVIREKSLYGRKYMGVDRSTFLFDKDGVLKREWRGVKVKEHAAEVLAAVKAL
ncbi:MAG: peroxiredoxin [Gammaproteobacteria bacterium]